MVFSNLRMRNKLFLELPSIASTSSTIIDNSELDNKVCTARDELNLKSVVKFTNNLRIKYRHDFILKNHNYSQTTRIKHNYFYNSLTFGLVVLISLFSLICANDENKVSVFLVEPNSDPYYVKEHDVGPLIRCVIADGFKNRSRYELEWMKIVGGFPMYVFSMIYI